MWCITGVPGSGKSTICRMLNENGIRCVNVMDIQGAEKCNENGEVDIECMKSVIVGQTFPVVEGHFSHLLNCSDVIILERSEEATRKELERRGYEMQKIEENLDALRSGILYAEALEKMPSGRIHRIMLEEEHPDIVLAQCIDLISGRKNKS